MEKILISIKHNFRFLWKIIERINDLLFQQMYGNTLKKTTRDILKKDFKPEFSYSELHRDDLARLHILIENQPSEDLKYFHPHDFDVHSIETQYTKRSFLMLGVFAEEKLIGYFFLRFFANRKCFVGRLIDKDFRGKGIGPVMNEIMYGIAWKMNFRCLSTISRNNTAVMKAHQKNNKMVIIKELDNDYLLVEFSQT